MPEVPADPVPTKPCSSISKYHASRVSMAPNRMHSTKSIIFRNTRPDDNAEPRFTTAIATRRDWQPRLVLSVAV